MDVQKYIDEQVGKGIQQTIRDMKPRITIKKYGRDGKTFSEETAKTEEDAGELLKRAAEEYDSTIEARATVHIVKKNGTEGIAMKDYTIGYCQQYREWEDFLEAFDVSEVFSEE